MKVTPLLSDQLYNWSAYEGKNSQSFTAPKESTFYTCLKARGINSQRLAYRTVQAVREGRLQMCAGTWTWTKVLPVGKSAGENAGDGLCPIGTLRQGKNAYQKLLPSSRNTGRDLLNQSRTATPQRGVLAQDDSIFGSAYAFRFSSYRRRDGQHVASFLMHAARRKNQCSAGGRT